MIYQNQSIGETMAGDPKKYTDEYRREAADYALASEKPAAQIAKELGINKKTFYTWVNKRKAEINGDLSSVPINDSPETREMKKRIHELEMENEFLKKAAAFFAKEQR